MLMTLGYANADSRLVYKTGNALLRFCESESAADIGFCAGYLEAIVDDHITLQGWKHDTVEHFCIPDEVETGQLKMVWIKYAHNNPESLHRGAASLLMNAFNQAWPCK
jgi:hypothetical protein